MSFRPSLIALVAIAALAAATAWAADPPAAGQKEDKPSAAPADGKDATAPAAAVAQDQDDEDLEPSRTQPDFTLITLPTTLRLPRYKSAFRVTHRFSRPLGQGDFGDLVNDFFGFDSSALIGLEFRFSLMRGAQVGIYRTSDKTIEFFAQYDIVRQSDEMPVGLAAFGTVEGVDNFREQYSPGIGVIVSRSISDRLALYAEPLFVGNTSPLPEELTLDNSTFMVGLGARLRVARSTYVVGEWTPRAAGFDPGVDHKTFALEKRVGGHIFQVNLSNSFGSTLGQVARGGFSDDDWHIGFNISRKFF